MDDAKAVLRCAAANGIDCLVAAGFVGVACFSGGATGVDQVATAAGLGVVVFGLEVDFLAVGLDAVGVVSGELEIRFCLGFGIDAGVG